MSTPEKPAGHSILVVEDEAAIRRFVRLALGAEGHTVHEADSVARGLIEAGTRRPDLVVLDLGLPDGDGIEVIRGLRSWSTVPVIVLSARSQEADKIAALDAGADDYLVKPFGAGELMARVRAQLRRHYQQTPGGDPLIAFGDVRIDLARRTAERAAPPSAPASRCTSRPSNTSCSPTWRRSPTASSPTSNCSRPCGAPAMRTTRTTCACTWPTCARRWRTTPPCPGTCAPRQGSAIGLLHKPTLQCAQMTACLMSRP